MNTPQIQIFTEYQKLESKIEQCGNLVLELARNPDTTPEQLFEGATIYRRVLDSRATARRVLAEKFPAGHYPWLTKHR